jgi:cell division protein FtsB
MKKLLLLSLIALSSGCGTIDIVKKEAYKAEIKHAKEWKAEKLEEEIAKLIAEGEMTEKQAEKVREGAYWILDKIIERAERLKKELETKETTEEVE